MADHNPRPRCPYCGGEATLIEGYWQTGNEYRVRWVCTKKDAASQLVRAKHRKDAVDKALEAANQSPWEHYSVVDPFSKKADKQKRSDAFHDLAGEDPSPAPSRA